MKFTIYFCADRGHTVNTESTQIGLRLIKDARLELGVNLPLERFTQKDNGRCRDLEMSCTEDFAELSGLFNDNSRIKVRTYDKALNWAVYHKLVYDKHEETGEIISAWFTQEINEKAVLDAWAECGYPLEWDGKKPQEIVEPEEEETEIEEEDVW